MYKRQAYVTPTAVIKQINLLEESLGVKLFDRTHRGLTLTKACLLYTSVGWMVRHYQEQEELADFEKMTPAERRCV